LSAAAAASPTPPSAEHKDENADVKAAVKTIPSIGSLMNDAANRLSILEAITAA
jgi:hypothetical protein